jgi:hypothetical protein
MSVLRDWVSELTLKQQTVLLCALRGCDQVQKEDISKKFVRKLRVTVIKNAVPLDQTKFMKVDITSEEYAAFLKQPDHYPVHWLMHFIHAVEVIGYFHPEIEIRDWWFNLYCDLCEMLHVNRETPSQNLDRLKDGVPSDCYKA